ncbi:MAG: hypothetical protein NWQ54_14380, partial [Paraglaciecola sp.]|nr:hypothetical protein [Paraglaciecola sp.]
MSLSLPVNDNFNRLLEELKAFGEKATELASLNESYQQFIERFPAKKLSSLTLDEYCIGKGTGDSFCWWLERGIEPALGRYMPGTSRGHIIYFQPNGDVYKHKALSNLSDSEALAYTLKIQAEIAKAADDEDWRWVDDDDELYRRAGVTDRLVTIGHGRKLRILSAYHPDNVVPISSSAHLGHFLMQLGFPKDELPSEKQPVSRMLLLRDYWKMACQIVPNLTLTGFMHGLYSPNLGLAPTKDMTIENELHITLTDGAIRNGYISIPKNQTLFPQEYIADHESSDSKQFVLKLPDNSQITTCLLSNKNRIKARFNSLFKRLQLTSGEQLVLSRLDEGVFEMRVSHEDSDYDAGEDAAVVSVAPTNQERSPLNQILYGPPGTGKTYETIRA